MDMRYYMGYTGSDVERYQAPMCFELAGSKLDFTMDGGETVSLRFAAFPSAEVFVGGSERGLRYSCAKIGDRVFYVSYLLPEACAGYVLDMDAYLVTRVITDRQGQSAICFGTGGKVEERHAFTKEMNGNTLQWTLGETEASAFRLAYADNALRLTRPNAEDAPALEVSAFEAVRINENVILQVLSVQTEGVAYYVHLVSNFWNITCVGSIYGGSQAQTAVYKQFAGYGRYVAERGEAEEDLYKLSPFRGRGISQFMPPFCYELAGESFSFVMDDGYDYLLRVIDDKTLEWQWAGDAPKQESYLCLKGDDTTYLLSFELAGVSPRVNHTFVIDRENYLVTRLISRIGTNPKYPYLMKTEYEFGAIQREEEEIRIYPRHGFSDDVTGTAVQWSYDSETASQHAYYCSSSYRITYPRDPNYSVVAKRMNDMFNNFVKRLPSTDEPCTYIKIKDGMYLFTLTEANGEKILGAEMGGFRSNTMSYLHNFKTRRTYGRSFGTSTPPDKDEVHRHLMYAAYGKLTDPEIDDSMKKMFHDPNPFIIGAKAKEE